MKNKRTEHIRVERLSHEGRGIAHIDGKTTFIDFCLPDEIVNIRYHRHQKQFAEAEALSVENPAADRVLAKCSAFQRCGGCSLQHWDPASQIQHKENVLLEQLNHFAGITPKNILPPLLGPTYGYRRKARMAVRFVEKKQELLIGFREKYQSQFVTDTPDCQILDPKVARLIPHLKTCFLSMERFREIPQVEIAMGEDAIAFVIRHLMPLSESDIAHLQDFSEKFSVKIYLQPAGYDSVKLLSPADADPLLEYHLPEFDCKFQFHPCDFTQVNDEINRKMISQAMQLLAPESHEAVLDLFCGLGNFSLPIARHAKSVVGVEGDQRMVNRAGENALFNGIRNAEFFKADLSHSFRGTAWAQQKFQKILLDPPRTGAKEIIKPLVDFKAEKILYVSCNPASLARDAGEICRQGYELQTVGVMDMFPHTTHVESMALFALQS